MRIVVISDTHEREQQIVVPDGDVLIHCGDITNKGSLNALRNFSDWLKALPHKNKVIIWGNHDLFENIHFERNDKADEARRIIEEAGGILLNSSEIVIDGIKFYGDPHQPRFFDWAFNVDRGPKLAKIWSQIPDDVTVLCTHGPPYKILDEAPRGIGQFDNVGCEDLLARIKELKQLKLHCFGHIHNSYNVLEKDGVIYANAAICTEEYKPTNPPIIIDLP